MKTMTTDCIRTRQGHDGEQSLYRILLRIAAALAWNAF